jgi:hypothetical protein
MRKQFPHIKGILSVFTAKSKEKYPRYEVNLPGVFGFLRLPHPAAPAVLLRKNEATGARRGVRND